MDVVRCYAGAGLVALWLCSAPCRTAACRPKAGGGSRKLGEKATFWEVFRDKGRVTRQSLDSLEFHWIHLDSLVTSVTSSHYTVLLSNPAFVCKERMRSCENPGLQDLYADRHIQVLVSTATLAWGQHPRSFRDFGHGSMHTCKHGSLRYPKYSAQVSICQLIQ